MQPTNTGGQYNAVQTGPSGNQQVQVVYAPAPVAVYKRYDRGCSKTIGAIQITIGILCMIFNVLLISLDHSGLLGHGIWCGIMFIVTGSLGVCAGNTQARCKIVAFMVLCIISALMALIVFSFGVAGAASASEIYRIRCHYGDCSWKYYNVTVACHAMLAILGMIEVIVAIWGSVNCCRVCCGCASATSSAGVVLSPGQPQGVQGHPSGNPQMMQGYPRQPQVTQGYPNQPQVVYSNQSQAELAFHSLANTVENEVERLNQRIHL